MANYKINEKSKTISVSAELTKIEESIISTYIKNGYTVKEKRASSAARVGDEDILAYFDEKKDEAGKAKYEAEKEKKIKQLSPMETKISLNPPSKKLKKGTTDTTAKKTVCGKIAAPIRKEFFKSVKNPIL